MADGWPQLTWPTATTNTPSSLMASRCSTRTPPAKHATYSTNPFPFWPLADYETINSHTQSLTTLAESRARAKDQAATGHQTKHTYEGRFVVPVSFVTNFQRSSHVCECDLRRSGRRRPDDPRRVARRRRKTPTKARL